MAADGAAPLGGTFSVPVEADPLDLLAALEEHPVPMVHGRVDRICWANRAARRLLGAPLPGGLRGRPLIDFFPEVERQVLPEVAGERHLGVVKDLAGTPRRVAYSVSARGELYTVTFDYQPAAPPAAEGEPAAPSESGDGNGPDSVGRDRRLAGLGMLVAGVAHEINNPLTFVLPGLQDALTIARQAKRVPATQREELESILQDCLEGVERVAKIASDLREFKKGDDGVSRVDVNTVVMDTLRLADERLRGRVTMRHVLGMPGEVVASATRLGQVILNLVLNAAQSMPDRPLDDSLIVVRTWTRAEWIHVSVEDNGSGIEEAKLGTIFDPFYSTKNAGTGLGLSVCAGIVKRAGGWIEVNSSPGQGSVFTVVLPLAEPQGTSLQPSTLPPPKSVPHQSVAPLSAEGGPVRILVVDDEPLVMRSVRRMLRRKAELVQATGGWEAIRLLQEGLQVNFVVSDMVMPEGSGQELWKWIKEHRPELRKSFCFMTGMAPATEPDPTMPPVIQKPFSLDDIEGVLVSRRSA